MQEIRSGGGDPYYGKFRDSTWKYEHLHERNPSYIWWFTKNVTNSELMPRLRSLLIKHGWVIENTDRKMVFYIKRQLKLKQKQYAREIALNEPKAVYAAYKSDINPFR